MKEMKDRIYSFMGLAMKAGKLVSGDESCEIVIKKKDVYLVIVTEDASDNTKKKFTDMCKYRGIDIRFFGLKESVGRYIGKDIRSVIALTDVGFAKRLIGMIDGNV